MGDSNKIHSFIKPASILIDYKSDNYKIITYNYNCGYNAVIHTNERYKYARDSYTANDISNDMNRLNNKIRLYKSGKKYYWSIGVNVGRGREQRLIKYKYDNDIQYHDGSIEIKNNKSKYYIKCGKNWAQLYNGEYGLIYKKNEVNNRINIYIKVILIILCLLLNAQYKIKTINNSTKIIITTRDCKISRDCYIIFYTAIITSILVTLIILITY